MNAKELFESLPLGNEAECIRMLKAALSTARIEAGKGDVSASPTPDAEDSQPCPYNCDEGGICLAELSGYPESCPRRPHQSLPMQSEHDKTANADPAVTEAREAFLDLIADAKTFHTETDGDETGVHTQHTIVTADGQLRALAKALGIEVRWQELTEDAISRAIDAGPQASLPSSAPADVQAVAWQHRACIGGQWGSWLNLDAPIDTFRERYAFNLDNGTMEVRPLYDRPSSEELRREIAGRKAELSTVRQQREELRAEADRLRRDRDRLSAVCRQVQTACEVAEIKLKRLTRENAKLAGMLDRRAAESSLSVSEGWKPMDSAPKDGTEFLWRSPEGVVAVIHWPTYDLCWQEGLWLSLNVLPALPSTDEGRSRKNENPTTALKGPE